MSKKIEVKTGKVWARYNGVSIAVTPATEEYARTYYYCGEPFEHDWRRPGDEVYPNCEHITCAETGEIIMPSKRIPIKQPRAIPANVLEAIWQYEKNIEELTELSKRLYNTADNDSPMWRAIEMEMNAECSVAMEFGMRPETFVAIYHDPAHRIAHGLKPVEVRHEN